MAKYYGKIGFAEDGEVRKGVWDHLNIVERSYSGDVVRNRRQLTGSDKVVDDINVTDEISIIADPYAYHHFFTIQYATYQGVRWKVTSVAVESPRLILTLGGIYNGSTAEET